MELATIILLGISAVASCVAIFYSVRATRSARRATQALAEVTRLRLARLTGRDD